MREFDWQPAVPVGDDYVPGARGTDYRIEGPSGRTSAAERKAARNARRDGTGEPVLELDEDAG